MTSAPNLSKLKTLAPEVIQKIFDAVLYDDDAGDTTIDCSEAPPMAAGTRDQEDGIVVGHGFGRGARTYRERRHLVGHIIAPSCRFLHSFAIAALWQRVTISSVNTLETVADLAQSGGLVPQPTPLGAKTHTLHLRMIAEHDRQEGMVNDLVSSMPNLKVFINHNIFHSQHALPAPLTGPSLEIFTHLVRVEVCSGNVHPTVSSVVALLNTRRLRSLHLDMVRRMDGEERPALRENTDLEKLCLGKEALHTNESESREALGEILIALTADHALQGLKEVHVHQHVPEFHPFFNVYGFQLHTLVLLVPRRWEPGVMWSVADHGHAVFDLCPNLQDLRCTSTHGFVVDGAPLLPTHHGTLRHITLTFIHDYDEWRAPRVDDMEEGIRVIRHGRFERLEETKVVVVGAPMPPNTIKWFKDEFEQHGTGDFRFEFQM